MIQVDGYGIIELNLTPIPSCFGSTWEKDVQPEVFRCHGTARDKRDIATDELPADVKAEMVAKLGISLTERLLNYDYTGEVDAIVIHHANRRFGNGGVTWETIKATAGRS